MPQIDVPGVGLVEFPDSMNDGQISQAIERDILPKEPTLGQKAKHLLLGDLSVADNLKRSLGLAARVPFEAISALPLAAADAGVAGRNLLTNENYTLPSQSYRQGLNQFLPEPTGIAEKTANFVDNVAVGGRLPVPQLGTKAGGLLGDLASKTATTFGRNTIKDATLAASQKLGYTVPPATANPTALNRILEGAAGKLTTAQLASAKNTAVTDQIAGKAVGLGQDSQITAGGLNAIRQEAAASGYEPLRQIGTMRGDTKLSEDLAKIASKYTGVSKDFPELSKTPLLDTIKAVDKKSFDSGAALDAISIIREKAASSGAAGEKALAGGYKKVATAIESAIERGLERRGENGQGLLSAFRDSRQLIAKTYSVEGALNPATGSVSATRLAQQLAKGKPLSGDLKKAAEFSLAFPKASRSFNESLPGISPVDFYASGGATAASKQPWYLLYPFLRQGIRAGILSPAGQGLLTKPGGPISPGLVGGAATGLLSSTQ